MPYLLAIQVDSYREFLQENVDPNKREDKGLHAALKSVFPIVSYSGNAALEYVELSARRAGVRRARVPLARHDLRRAAARHRAPGHLRQGVAGQQGRSSTCKEQEVYMGECRS